jgi:hypothetical protein
MDRKDPCTFFEQWLNAYSDHLHMVRQGQGIDLVAPQESKPPLPANKNETINEPRMNAKNANQQF